MKKNVAGQEKIPWYLTEAGIDHVALLIATCHLCGAQWYEMYDERKGKQPDISTVCDNCKIH